MTTQKSNQPLPWYKRHFRILIWLGITSPFWLLMLVICGIMVFGDLPEVEDLLNPETNQASLVYSMEGRELAKYYNENRVSVSFKQLDSNLVNALIATEDVRFFSHSGIDFQALFRSVFGVITASNKGGGSTITQQLAKMMFPRESLSRPALVFRKFKEWIIAVKLEGIYSKQEIIALYLNKFDFLNQAVGIRSAAYIYFNTRPDSLSLEQSAMLIGMAKNPSLFNPIRKPEKAKVRRNVVLAQMKKYGFITESDFMTATRKPLGIHFNSELNQDIKASYFKEFLRTHMLSDWAKANINPETGKAYNIYRDGLKIYTTLDSRMQHYAEQAVTEHMRALQQTFLKECKNKRNAPFAYDVTPEQIRSILWSSLRRTDRYRVLKKEGLSDTLILHAFKEKVSMRIYTKTGERDTLMSPWDSIRYYKSFLHTGFVALESSTGFIKAWVGGINYKHFKYDHVGVGRRQVGSTFKPFVYALAIQEGKSPCYKVPNEPICIDNWCPDNSDGSGGGRLTLKSALARSINRVSAWLIKQYGPKAVIQLARQMGVTSPLPDYPSICLGTPEITLLEMVGAINTFPNQGTYIMPECILRIEDRNGRVIYKSETKSTEVMDAGRAYTMVQLMRGVVDIGTGTRLRHKYRLMNEIAGKTGTTQRNADGWFIGYTPELTAGVWVGGEERSIHFNSTADGQGASMALPIWALFFSKIYNDPELKMSKDGFVKPASLDPNLDMDCSDYTEELEASEQAETDLFY